MFKLNVSNNSKRNISITTLLLIFIAVATYGIGEQFPPGLNHDAAANGIYALKILDGIEFKIFHNGDSGRETPFMYLIAAMFWAFGISKETIELSATICGSMAVVFFFLIVNNYLKNYKYAFLSTIPFVFSSALITYSRVGWRNIALIPAILSMLLFCHYIILRPSYLKAIILGFIAALVLNLYQGGRLAAAFIFVFWLILILKNRDKTTLSHCFISITSFLIACIPTILLLTENTNSWMSRISTLTAYNDSVHDYLNNFLITFGFFNFSANGNDFYVHQAILVGPITFFWFLGFILSHFKIKNFWPLLSLFWLSILPAILSVPSFHRAIGSLGLVYLFAIIGASTFLKIINKIPLRKNYKHYLMYTIISLILITQCTMDWYTLYVYQTPFKWGFYPNTTVVGKYMSKQDKPLVVYARNWPKDALRFFMLANRKNEVENKSKFTNYQTYNTKSKDGLHELINNWNNGNIHPNSLFIIDQNNIMRFKKIATDFKRVTKLFDKNGVVIAEVVSNPVFKTINKNFKF